MGQQKYRRSLSGRMSAALAWAIVFSLCGVTACTTMRVVDVSDLTSGSAVRPGDMVRLTTTDDRDLLIKVTAVSDLAITGERPASTAGDPDSGYETDRRYPDSRREVVVPIASIETLKVRLAPDKTSDASELFGEGFVYGLALGVLAFALILGVQGVAAL